MLRQDKELQIRVKTIQVLRMVFLTGFVFLLIAFERNATRATPILPLSIVLCSAYILALGYALLMRFQVRLALLAWLQVIGDLLVVGGLIFTTGGIESPLSFLFLFVIISTSVMLPRAACYKVAAGASIIYGLLVDLEYFNIINPIYFFPKANISFQGAYLFYIVVMNLASYFSVAYLSGILSHRLRLIKEELEEKSLDLKKLQEFHYNVVQNMGNGLWTTDSQGRVISANRAAAEITGYSLEEMEGKLCFQMLPMISLVKFYQDPEPLPVPRHLEDQCPRRDGTRICVGMKISEMLDSESKNRSYICVFEDLTEIQEMEEKVKQNEQLAAVGRFSAGLAHEIRNPLASLSGSIQVLQNGMKLEGDFKRLMEIVIKETERLDQIVSDFLSFSQPKKKRSRSFNLTGLLEETILLMKNSNEYDPEIVLNLSVPPDPVIINCDEEMVKQMVWNLAINGLQSMDHEGTLTLSLKPVEGFTAGARNSGKSGILFCAEDEGKGIPKDRLDCIFDPFFTTRDEGVGLGLATVKKIVEDLGGLISVSSEVGKGTRFEVFLPLSPSFESQEETQMAIPESSA